MSQQILNDEQLSRIDNVRRMAQNETMTAQGLQYLIQDVPNLVESLAGRLQVQYDRTETLRMQVKDLEGRLADTARERDAALNEMAEARRERTKADHAVKVLLNRIADPPPPTVEGGRLAIDDVVNQAYQTAKDKGWHDPADADDLTVVEVRRRLCGEGLRSLSLCRVAEMLRRGGEPRVGDYLNLFSIPSVNLPARDTRLVADLMLVITEVGEAIEDVIDGNMEEQVKDGKPTGVPSELADVVIRVGHICGHRGIDLAGAVRRKLAYNKTRPHKHGKKA